MHSVLLTVQLNRLLDEHRKAKRGVKKKREEILDVVAEAIAGMRAEERARADAVADAKIRQRMGGNVLTVLDKVFDGDDVSLKRAAAQQVLKWVGGTLHEGVFTVDRMGSRYQ